jgi:hypothetical protein
VSNESTELKLSAQRALLGHVSPCLRSASIDKVGDVIRWHCFFDADATEADFELASMAGSEIVGDYLFPATIDEKFIIVPFPEKMENLKYLVYYRHEHNYYRG